MAPDRDPSSQAGPAAGAGQSTATTQSTAATSRAGITRVLARNIRALEERRRQEEAQARWSERVAEAITRFTGSMLSVTLHAAFFGVWVVVNLGWLPGIEPWDPSFVTLAMIASVEAIFLTTFILISQNRMAAADKKRAELDLQISLLAEDEITELAKLTAAIAERVGVVTEREAAVEEVVQPIAPEAVLDALESTPPRESSN